MLISIGKQSGESVKSVLKKKRKGYGGKDLRKGRFKAWNEGVRGDGILIIIRIVAYDRIKFCSKMLCTTALEIV